MITVTKCILSSINMISVLNAILCLQKDNKLLITNNDIEHQYNI